MRAFPIPLCAGFLQTSAILLGATFLAGCTSTADQHTIDSAPDAEQPARLSGAFSVTLWGFLDLQSPGTGGPTQKPQNVYVTGQIYDGPYPENLVDTALNLPEDATPGCAVYRSVPPNCVGIGGCGEESHNATCAANATTNPCVCTATDTCRSYPKAMNAGRITVAGIADTSGATSFELANLSNHYQTPSTVNLSYPGFAEGDDITLSATGGDTPPFRVQVKGVAPLSLAPRDEYVITKSATSNSPTQYDALTLQWTPPADASNTTIHVEIDLSRHGGTVGYLACDAPDTGLLTISAGLTTQLVELGNIAGFAELTIARVASQSTGLEGNKGEVEFEVSSEEEYVINVQGYESCLQDSDCPSGQTCDRSVKLCGGI